MFSISYTAADTGARCPRYYFYDRVMKIEAQSKRLGMMFGSAGHTGLHKLYDTKNLDSCLDAAFKAWEPFEGQDVSKDGKPGVRTWAKLKEILTAYYNQIYVNEKWTDQGGEILESFLIEIPPFIRDAFLGVGYTEEAIRYRFKIDRKGLSGDVPAIQEWKFLKPILGSDFVPEPNNQIVGYLKGMQARKAVVTVAKVQVSSVEGMIKGRTKDAEPHSIFTRDPVFYDPHVFEEFSMDMLMWSFIILSCTALGYWPKNAPGACNYFGGCQFKQLCASDPEQRKVLIELSFQKKEPMRGEK